MTLYVLIQVLILDENKFDVEHKITFHS